MNESEPTMAQRIAQAAIAFQKEHVGRVPKSVTVVISADTLVITMHGALSPAEQAVAKTPEGAFRVQEFHKQLFANSSEPMRKAIATITGADVGESAADFGPAVVTQAFSTGTMVQVYLLSKRVAGDTFTSCEIL